MLFNYIEQFIIYIQTGGTVDVIRKSIFSFTESFDGRYLNADFRCEATI